MSEFNWDDHLKTLWKNLVYIARYGSDSITDMQDWEISKVVRVSHLLSEVIAAENG